MPDGVGDSPLLLCSEPFRSCIRPVESVLFPTDGPPEFEFESTCAGRSSKRCVPTFPSTARRRGQRRIDPPENLYAMGATLVANKKARHEYDILEKLEAGIVLTGTEVKSCRARNISFGDGYARIRNGELWLIGVHIAEYSQGNRANHNPTRDRKLLLHRREIVRLRHAIEARGLTLVPLRFYLSPRNLVKVELGLCRGRNIRDKRQSLRKKAHDRETARAIAARKA